MANSGERAGLITNRAPSGHSWKAFRKGLPLLWRASGMATSRPSRDWYWIADEIEAAGCLPLLTHAAKAKLTMGNINKTDKLDAKGLAKLLHLDSLPTVWLPPGETRDERELHRTRMAFSKLRTALKNRIHATLAKYGSIGMEHSDIFAGAGRAWLSPATWHKPLTPCCERRRPTENHPSRGERVPNMRP